MDYAFEKQWNDLLAELSREIGEPLDMQALLFLIGVQELKQVDRSFKKDEKIDLMHVAICTLLEPFGYYSYEGKDDEGWPHFSKVQNLPALEPRQQEMLMRKAILNYFEKED